MRLLWDENVFGVIGAFCVAAFALAVTWVVLEGMLGLGGALAGVVAFATAVATLEGLSRRQYEQRLRSPSLHRVPADRAATARTQAATVRTQAASSRTQAASARRSDEPAARRRAA